MSKASPSLLGISFDGLAISGIVNEFLSVADVLRRRNLRVLFDLGYDITMGRTPDCGPAYFPPWVTRIRSLDGSPPPEYVPNVIDAVIDRVVAGTPVRDMAEASDVCAKLASKLTATFERENVRILVVENGTLPDNPLFTEAIYNAIRKYGESNGMGKYVLWRDQDLMWSAEPHFYGPFPYPGVHRPEPNPYIHYAITTEWMRLRMRSWAPETEFHIMPNRFFRPAQRGKLGRFRKAYNIPEDAYLIARCTRVVPQKGIERDIRLLAELQRRLSAASDCRRILLFVTGPVKEDPDEFERLVALERRLPIAGQIIWADGLLPFNQPLRIGADDDRFSVCDLLAEADMSSFLTSYDYEGFGNPPGESMAMGVPFVATTYELYHEVYGSKGAIAPLLPIDRSSTAADPIPSFFVDWTLRVLTDLEYRKEIAERNLKVYERFYSLAALERQIVSLFGDALAG